MPSAVSRHAHCPLWDEYSLEDVVNVILVVGHEKLNVEMQRTYGSRMTVVKIPKSGGVRTPRPSVPVVLPTNIFV